jgi:serine/threonine-protein kinase
MLVLPQLPGKFELIGRHAEGAICEVFKAHHVALDIGVAVKVLRPEYATDPCFVERMRVEAQVLPRLKSRHIVQCFDRGITEDDRPYTVLEFLRGQTLDVLLEKLGAFDEPTVIELGAALFDALGTAHTRGVVHRDVTLRNLILHSTEHDPPTLKLIDFGFAWIMPDAPPSAPEPAEITEHNVAIGTPRFVSPEVARGDPFDGRADLYSAGVVLYTLLAGRDPFADIKFPDAVLEAHAYTTLPPLSLHARKVSRDLERVVMRLLEKNPSDRYPSAKEAARALLETAIVRRCPAPVSRTVPLAPESAPDSRKDRGDEPVRSLLPARPEAKF